MEAATHETLRRLQRVARLKSHTDTSGSPSETDRSSLLESLGQRWNEFVQGIRTESVDDVAYAIATERRARAELYPPIYPPARKIERRVRG